MALFVHRAPESRIARIRRTGICRLRRTCCMRSDGVAARGEVSNRGVLLGQVARSENGPPKDDLFLTVTGACDEIGQGPAGFG